MRRNKPVTITLAKFSHYDLALKVVQNYNSYGQDCFFRYEQLLDKEGMVIVEQQCIFPLDADKVDFESAVLKYKEQYQNTDFATTARELYFLSLK